jgi:Matrixin
VKMRLPPNLRSFVVIILCLTSALTEAGGNRLTPSTVTPGGVDEIHWDDRMLPIKWVFSRDGYPESGFSNKQLIQEFEAAFNSWEMLPTSRIDFEFAGQVDKRRSEIDGLHLVTFTDPDVVFPAGVLGYAFTYSFSTDTVVGAHNNDLNSDGLEDIPVGTYKAGAIFDGNIVLNSSLRYTISGIDGTSDIQSIALHEVGHFIGLSHSSIEGASMWPFMGFDVSLARELSADDAAFASYFYQQEPTFSAAFGLVSGLIRNGVDDRPLM